MMMAVNNHQQDEEDGEGDDFGELVDALITDEV